VLDKSYIIRSDKGFRKSLIDNIILYKVYLAEDMERGVSVGKVNLLDYLVLLSFVKDFYLVNLPIMVK
jgi:hypothetical protein